MKSERYGFFYYGFTFLYTEIMNYCLQLSVNMTNYVAWSGYHFSNCSFGLPEDIHQKFFFFDLLLVVTSLKTVFKETDELYLCDMIP